MNIHLRVTRLEYDAILAEARRQGKEPQVQRTSDGKEPLFATVEVKLFVNPSARHFKSASIHDGTYSRHVLHIEQENE